MADAQPLTPEELAKLVKLSSTLTGLVHKSDKALTVDEAASILAGRIKDATPPDIFHALTFAKQKDPLFGGSADPFFNDDIAKLIATAMPGKTLTPAVLASMDIRPWLEAINGHSIRSERDDPSWTNAFGELGAKQEYNYKLDLTPIIDGETARVQETVNADPASDTVDVTSYKSGTADVLPTPVSTNAGGQPVDPNGNPLTTAQASAGGMVDTDGDGVPDTFAPSTIIGGTAVFPVDDMRTAIQTGAGDLMSLATADAQYQQQFPGQSFPVEVKAPVNTPMGADRQMMNIPDALKYLHTLNPRELGELQEKMAAAGYYDKLGGNNGYLKGDALDENTFAAWKQVLTDSITENQPVPIILGNKMHSYRNDVRDARLKQLGAMDPVYLQHSANDIAQSLLGRDLNADEYKQALHFFTNLRQDRAGYVAGAAVNPPASVGGLQGDAGYTQDDVAEYISTKSMTEQRDLNSQKLGYQLRRMMG